MTVNELIARWEGVRAGLLATIETFSAQELDYVAVQKGYSVAQLILHIAHEEEGEIRYGVTRELTEWPPEFAPSQYLSLEALIRILTEVHQRTENYLRTLQDADLEREVLTPWGKSYTLSDLFWHVLEHEIHHRGELSLVLGLLGHEGLNA